MEIEKEKEIKINKDLVNNHRKLKFFMNLIQCIGLTGSKYLSKDAFLMSAVNIVGCLPGFVGAVKKAAIFRVPQQQFSQLSASPSDSNVECRVSLL